MAITLRNTKGLPLTHVELDGNFTDLDTRVNTLENTVNTDSQTLTLVGTDLSISGGNTVDLSSLLDDTNTFVSSATFNSSNGELTITKNDASTVVVNLDGRYLTSETDSQTLSLTGDTLSISGGNSVDLSKYTDSTFSGDFADLTNNPFTISGLPGTTEIGFTGDVFDFGTGNTVDLQGNSVLFNGATVTGLKVDSLFTVEENYSATPTTKFFEIETGSGNNRLLRTGINMSAFAQEFGPEIDLTSYRSSPANGDAGPGLVFRASTGASVNDVIATIKTEVIDTTNGAVTSKLSFTTETNGSSVTPLTIYGDTLTNRSTVDMQGADQVAIGKPSGQVKLYGDVEFNNGTTTFVAANSVDFLCPVDFDGATVQNFAPGSIYANSGQYLYVISEHAGGSATNVAFIYDDINNRPRQIIYGKTEFANNGEAAIVDFTGATVTGTNFLTAESDTLATVTARGASTADTVVLTNGAEIGSAGSITFETENDPNAWNNGSINTEDYSYFFNFPTNQPDTTAPLVIGWNDRPYLKPFLPTSTGAQEETFGAFKRSIAIEGGDATETRTPGNVYLTFGRNITQATFGDILIGNAGSGDIHIGKNPGSNTAYDGTINVGSNNSSLNLRGNVNFTNANVTGLTLDGDLTGSVFADDSTLLVDGVNGKLVGDYENGTSTIGSTRVESYDIKALQDLNTLDSYVNGTLYGGATSNAKNLAIGSTPPSTSNGASGDRSGMIAFDSTYIYYCTANYTDGVADIWKRVAWSTDTW